MATIEVCDICGSRDGVLRHFYSTDRQTDGAGSMEDVGDTYDLCIKHQADILEATITTIKQVHKIPKYTVNQYSVNAIKARIK